MLFACAAAALDDNGADIPFARFFEAGSVGFITDDDRNFGARYLAAPHSVDESDHIRSAAGNEDGDIHLMMATETTEITERFF